MAKPLEQIQRQLVSTIKLVINAAAAKPSPPVGPALGQAGLNIMSFCKDFNAKTGNYKEGIPLRVFVRVYSDKTYDWILKTPPSSWLIKKASGLERAADKPGHEVIGNISLKHIYEIAKVKRRDVPNVSLEALCKNLISTCQSMGIKVAARPGDP
ncbi:hypothetical protein CEUSTIGMA_g5869.t1 [Chlamydomonas eustigma]|uniref:Large ribosomal subunit protein uL11m n=1 Tax=Chlamydomonas eustigma TaxID=1157962 RepID=A0A250X5U2_9CHLO|nr:hypothetical protein CEUSTIGMA_g5869.t1 [Chlamydomonas eustigma]|eukprot:GAX78428.1 hypothetical protein CEUSTIGMA_g5869.t1 [Chlamydomonas eustigma]